MDSQQHLRIDRAIFLHSGSLGSGKRGVTESRHVGTAQPVPGPRKWIFWAAPAAQTRFYRLEYCGRFRAL
jgi:hypothetical protein